MKNPQKGKVALIVSVLIVLVLIGVGAAAYFHAPSQNAGTASSADAAVPSDWKTYSVSPGPDSEISASYPSTWDVSEANFSCGLSDDAGAGAIGFISPTRTDLPGYAGVSAAYLIDLCAPAGKAMFVGHEGFVRSPSDHAVLGPSDELILSTSTLQAQPEYQTGKRIAGSFSGQM